MTGRARKGKCFMKMNKIENRYKYMYFFQYFGIGAFLPLLSVYLKSIGLTGIQIGTITSIGSLMTIISPPLWGIISDRTHKHKMVILFMMTICIISGFLIPTATNYVVLMPIFIVFNIGMSAMNPLTDGITISSPYDYGKTRLWGSVGFAIAAFSIGKLVVVTQISIIFYGFIISLLIAMYFLIRIPVSKTKSSMIKFKDIKVLLTNKDYVKLLLITLLTSGTINGNNIFFGLLFEELGGQLSMVGFAFLLFAISEVPIMHYAQVFLRKYGDLKLLAIAVTIGWVRWFIYAIVSSPNTLLWLFFLQGLFFGLYFVSIADFTGKRVQENLRSTAITLNVAVGFGIGGMITNYISGLLYEWVNAQAIYAFYSISCLLAIFIAINLYRSNRVDAVEK